MYLPTFYKLGFETAIFKGKRMGGVVPALALYGIWAFYPSLYNMVYTDFIPPARGVQRRIQE